MSLILRMESLDGVLYVGNKHLHTVKILEYLYVERNAKYNI